MSEELPASVFVRDSQRFVPTALAHGPWHPDSQHGSAMAGLLARAVENTPATEPMQCVRLTIDLMRAAPFAPLELETELRHAGKSAEFLEARLVAGGEVCARAHAVRYRIADLPAGDDMETHQQQAPALDLSARIPLPRGKRLALHDALHLSPVAGFAQPAMWVRMLVPLVADEVSSPLVRVAVAMDWVYAALSLRTWSLDPQRMARRPFVAINTDNHLTITRPCEGEWVCLDASGLYGSLGAGAASARVFDQTGLLGFATQTLLQRGLDKRPKAWG